MNQNWLRLAPLVILLLLSLALAMGLIHGKPKDTAATMIGYEVAPFTIPSLAVGALPPGVFSPKLWRGEVAVLSVFASWCAPCADEHPVLMKLAASGKVPLYGIAWKDTADKAAAWLNQHGNPYQQVGIDEHGSTTMLLGLSGVPELYLLDKKGAINYHHVGPLDDDTVNKVILPLVEKLNHDDAKK